MSLIPTETQLYKNLYGPSTKLEKVDPEEIGIDVSPLFGVAIETLDEYISLQYFKNPVVDAIILLATNLSVVFVVLKRTANF